MINVDEMRKYIDTLTGSFAIETYECSEDKSIYPWRDMRIRPLSCSRKSILAGKKNIVFLGAVYHLEDAFGPERARLYNMFKEDISPTDFALRFEMLFGRAVEFLSESNDITTCKSLIDLKTKKDVLHL